MDSGDWTTEGLQVEELTWREQEVLGLLAQRHTNQEIASQLHLAESTVKDYVSRILSKLYVKNRREAVTRARQLGLLDGEPKRKSRPTSSLPAETTPFIGRQAELREITRLLAATRLLTLSGPGGIGKTRLALKTAQVLTGDFKDGCHFISLAPLSATQEITQAMVQVFKFPLVSHDELRLQLLRYLRKKEMLLVLDNFEHLLNGVGIVSEIIEAAAGIKILVTSRERLNLHSETNLVIGGMAVPTDGDGAWQSGLTGTQKEVDGRYDAVSLFVQSAGKIKPGFDPATEELQLVSRICQAVEGMPLAIELAAAWLHILSVGEIAVELEKGLDILAAEVRDAPARHRSIRAVFDYSWSLLSEKEQAIFSKLTVFRGGFTREAAGQVAGATLPLLAGLANKSFLSHDQKSGRLEIHELLRQYGKERLEASPGTGMAIERAHADFYAKFLSREGTTLRGTGQMEALAAIDADLENIRKAWRFHIHQKDYSQIVHYLAGFWLLHWIRGWNTAGTELFGQAEGALDGLEEDDAIAVRALALGLQAYFMSYLNQADRGFLQAKQAEQVLETLGRKRHQTLVLDSVLINAYFIERFEEEFQYMDKMLSIAREIEDPWLVSLALYAASLGSLIRLDYDQARKLAEESLAISQHLGDRFGSSTAFIARGHSEFGLGNFEEARHYYLQCLDLAEEIGFHYSLQTASKYITKVNINLGRLDEAKKYLLQCLGLTKEAGFIRDIVNLLYEYARLLVIEDKPLEAIEILGGVLAHPAGKQNRMLEGRIHDSAKTLLAELEKQLPAERVRIALERGRQLDLEVVVGQLLASKR